MSEPKPVDPVDPKKTTSVITGPVDDGGTVLITSDDMMKCYWNDEEFENGARILAEGKCYEAVNGQWVEV